MMLLASLQLLELETERR